MHFFSIYAEAALDLAQAREAPLSGLIIAFALSVPATAAAQQIATSTGATFDAASVKASPRPEPNPFGFPRVETRDVSVYHLVTTRRDGSTGAQLRPSRVDCAALRLKRGPGGTAPANGSEPECQVSFRLSGGSMTISFKGETTSELARRVIPERDRPVVDKTGLSGTFDGELTFAPEPLPGFPRLPGSENGLSVFTALQEQWGLKLEPERGPVEILVIESAQKPTAN